MTLATYQFSVQGTDYVHLHENAIRKYHDMLGADCSPTNFTFLDFSVTPLVEEADGTVALYEASIAIQFGAEQ